MYEIGGMVHCRVCVKAFLLGLQITQCSEKEAQEKPDLDIWSH